MIRTATTKDAAAILEIYAPAVKQTSITFENEPPTTAEMAARIEKTTRRYPWLVVEEKNQVVGYAYAGQHRDRPAYRWSVEVSVYIHPAHHKKGLGKKLYEQLLNILKQQGFHNAYAGITLPNAASVALHEACGFTYLGTFPHIGFKQDRWHDVGWWHHTLNPPGTTPKEPSPPPQIQYSP